MKTIIITDDNKCSRIVLSTLLEKKLDGVNIVSVASGKDTLGIIEEIGAENIALILMDIQMPEMNGLETVVEIREIYQYIPVCFLSTVAEKYRTIIDEMGCDLITTPVKPEKIINMVKRLT